MPQEQSIWLKSRPRIGQGGPSPLYQPMAILQHLRHSLLCCSAIAWLHCMFLSSWRTYWMKWKCVMTFIQGPVRTHRLDRYLLEPNLSPRSIVGPNKNSFWKPGEWVGEWVALLILYSMLFWGGVALNELYICPFLLLLFFVYICFAFYLVFFSFSYPSSLLVGARRRGREGGKAWRLTQVCVLDDQWESIMPNSPRSNKALSVAVVSKNLDKNYYSML